MKKAILLISIVTIFLGCREEAKKSLLPGNEICGLASPVNFTGDTITFYVGDYLTDPNLLKKIRFPEGVTSTKMDQKGVYQLIKSEELKALSAIQLTTPEHSYDILVKNFRQEKVYIHLPDKSYDEVKVRGNLNFWNARMSTMHKTDTGWTEEFQLSPGEYQYLVVIDGKEQRDPTNSKAVDNNMGGFNSLLQVGNFKQENLPFISSVSAQGETLNFESSMKLDEVFAFWQNKKIETKVKTNVIQLEIPAEAKQLGRSFIRVSGYNQAGVSNDLLIPLEKGEVVMDPALLTRNDRHTMMMYFMMVDRFRDGNPENNDPVDDPAILPKANFYGGDLAGVLDEVRSGYFRELGVNTIWLSPIVRNPDGAYGQFQDPNTRFSGYHGYWPVSCTKIDRRFGTGDELKEIVSAAHGENMNVLVDYVANHVHELNPVYQQHPEWATSLYLPDSSLNTEKWDEYRLTTWFDVFLPTLDLRKKEVVDPMTDSALYWITEYGIDGFRHDATKHIDELYWRTLTRKLKLASRCDPMPYQIGETYGSPELISSYISSGMLDGQFDFNVYDNAVAVFAREEESFDRLQAMLNESLRYYGYHHLMGNITGNQDRARFISYAGGELTFNEDAKRAGWKRKIGVGNPTSYEKLKLLHVFNMTIPGIPTIYYGDEIGLPGGNDPDNRRWMKFDRLTTKEQDVRDLVSRLAKLRSHSLPLLYGDIRFVALSPSTWVFVRTYFGESVFILFNKSGKKQNIEFSHPRINGGVNITAFEETSFSVNGDRLNISLVPYSFEILHIK
ncbi:MAG: alpha-glucosidase C-terminal domain-containing protein [Bacteroidales bacterium]|nr:alpha-glucosidase C-terminal domain-containing protein [Bacteroidales bacterium]